MKRRLRSPAGWVPLKAAADRIGLHFETLRKLIAEDQFTGLRRTASPNSALFVPEAEVAAFVAGGGLPAVAALRARKARPGRARTPAGVGA